MRYPDGRVADAGEIVEAEPRRRLVIRWQHQNEPELKAEGASLCMMEMEQTGSAVKLSITSLGRHPVPRWFGVTPNLISTSLALPFT